MRGRLKNRVLFIAGCQIFGFFGLPGIWKDTKKGREYQTHTPNNGNSISKLLGRNADRTNGFVFESREQRIVIECCKIHNTVVPTIRTFCCLFLPFGDVAIAGADATAICRPIGQQVSSNTGVVSFTAVWGRPRGAFISCIHKLPPFVK